MERILIVVSLFFSRIGFGKSHSLSIQILIFSNTPSVYYSTAKYCEYYSSTFWLNCGRELLEQKDLIDKANQDIMCGCQGHIPQFSFKKKNVLTQRTDYPFVQVLLDLLISIESADFLLLQVLLNSPADIYLEASGGTVQVDTTNMALSPCGKRLIWTKHVLYLRSYLLSQNPA